MYKRIVEIANRIITIISVFFVVAMLAVLGGNVVMRYVFHNPIIGATEISQMIMVCLTCCMAPALINGEHVWITLLSEKFGRVTSMILDIVTILASMVMFGVMSAAAFNQMMTSMEFGRRYSMLKIPEWPFLMVFGFALAILTIFMILYLIDRIMTYAKGKLPDSEFASFQSNDE